MEPDKNMRHYEQPKELNYQICEKEMKTAFQKNCCNTCTQKQFTLKVCSPSFVHVSRSVCIIYNDLIKGCLVQQSPMDKNWCPD